MAEFGEAHSSRVIHRAVGVGFATVGAVASIKSWGCAGVETGHNCGILRVIRVAAVWLDGSYIESRAIATGASRLLRRGASDKPSRSARL